MKIVVLNFIAKVIACQSEDYFSLEVVTKALPIELILTHLMVLFLEVRWYKLEGVLPLLHNGVSLILDLEFYQKIEHIVESHLNTCNCNVRY